MGEMADYAIEQIEEVRLRTGVPSIHVRKFGVMMSKVKLAREFLKNDGGIFPDISMRNAKMNIDEALNYFEKEFLKCELW